MAKQKVKLPRKRKAPAKLGDVAASGEAQSSPTKPRPAKAKDKVGHKPKRGLSSVGPDGMALLDAVKSLAAPRKAKATGKGRASIAAPSGPADMAVPPKRAARQKSKPARKRRLAGAAVAPPAASGAMGRLERLERAIRDVRGGALASPRTRKLLSSGVAKMSQKVIEEAAEVAIEAIRGNRASLIDESVDLFYNLLALWSGSGVALADVWAEMDRREATLGMAEKLPKASDEEA